MRLLIDTQCWLWWFAEPQRLRQETIDLIANEGNELWFSVASVWEIGIKNAMAKLPLPEPIDHYIDGTVRELGAGLLEIKAAHALVAAQSPLHHRDPFARMIIAQAQVEGMAIVTSDRAFKSYDAQILWND
jgi:PIN domain nuclease of toxin-antitoxin system